MITKLTHLGVKQIAFIACLFFTNLLLAQTIVNLTGSGTWTVPAGVTSITVKSTGAGGGGGASGIVIGNNGGGGGAGGSYCAKTITVSAGNTFTYSVGVGGIGSSNATSPGSNGTASTFASADLTTNMSAGGGRGGNSNAGAGGIFVASTGGSVMNNGISGSKGGTNGGAGGYAGGAGSGSPGGATNSTGGNGSSGTFAGGGGSGGKYLSGIGSGGNGAAGTIIIEYTAPITPCTNIINIASCGQAHAKSFSQTGTGQWATQTCYTGTSDGKEQIYSFTPTASCNYSINIANFIGYYIEVAYKTGTCSNTGWTCIGEYNANGTYGSLALTANTTYYFLIDAEDASSITGCDFYIVCPSGPNPPMANTHTATETEITWSWTTVTGATGYKWNTTNNYATAIDMGTSTIKTETGLICGTAYTRYVWAYNGCGNSSNGTLGRSTLSCPITPPSTPCSSPTTIKTENFASASAPTGWATAVVTDNGTSPNVTFVMNSADPVTSAPSSYMAKFNSYSCGAGSEVRLYQTSSFATTGYTDVTVNFSWSQLGEYDGVDEEGVEVQWSTDGTTWTDAGFFGKVKDASPTWVTKSCALPAGANNQSTLYVAFLFRSNWKDNCYLDNIAIKGCVPSNMAYQSSTVAQASTDPISLCSANEKIICMQVSTDGTLNPLALTSLTMQMSGTAAISAIDKIHVYYTGTSNVFAPIGAFNGTGTNPATGNITITGNQTLSQGTNYFWITYDISETATVGQTLDAKITSATIGGSAKTPTVTDPTGTRTISSCVPSPGGVSNNLTAWYRADNGITQSSNKVSQWASSSSTTFTLEQTWAAYQPNYVAGSSNYKQFNYNKRLGFVGANSTGMVNTNSSPDLIGGGAGSMFAVLSKDEIDGTAVSYSNQTNKFQYKPKYRMQSGGNSYGSTIDVFQPADPSYSTFFPGEWSDAAAFINFAQGMNTALNIRVNAKATSTLTNSNSSTYKPSINDGISIGFNNGAEYVSCEIAEVIFYSANSSANELSRIESYLALKYGITLGGNAGTSNVFNYLSSASTTVFDKSTNIGYNNDIAGIGRDDASGLNQKQSMSVNITDILTIGLGTIATENSANTTTFPRNKSYVVWGNNGLATISNASTMLPAAAATLPAGIESRLPRVWKYQNTNFLGSGAGGTTPVVKVGFETFGLVNYTSLDKLRLLMDDDGVNWSNAWVSGATAVLNGNRIEFPNITLVAAQPYLTLASINVSTTPLPVQIKEFNVVCGKNETLLTWKTASEINNNFFTIERSSDLINWDWVATIDGAGNSNSLKKYSYTDNKPSSIQLYYRLKQTDFDGRSETFIPIAANCENEFTAVLCYPNPFKTQLNIMAKNIYADEVEVTVRNITGQVVAQQKASKDDIIIKGLTLNLNTLPQGHYSIEIKAGTFIEVQKILKNK